LRVSEIAEAAVIAARDSLKGVVPEIYVSLQPGITPSDAIAQKVVDSITRVIGPIARPRKVWMVPDLPKTRSGKIMRRILASIFKPAGSWRCDTLANPEVVQTIHQLVTTKNEE